MLLVAALFTRITKIAFPWGGEVDLGTSAALKRVINAKTKDTKRRELLYKKSAPLVANGWLTRCLHCT
jgi:hypothetical protein